VAISPASRDATPVAPLEYRHLRAFGVTRMVGGVVAAAAGIVCLSYEAYGWAAFFLLIAALDLAAGYWELTLAHSQSPPAQPHPGGNALTPVETAVPCDSVRECYPSGWAWSPSGCGLGRRKSCERDRDGVTSRSCLMLRDASGTGG
jgi:hypothetical protein